MKDGSTGNAILEFRGLRPKAYAYKIVILREGDEEKEGGTIEIKKLKCIQIYEVKKISTLIIINPPCLWQRRT